MSSCTHSGLSATFMGLCAATLTRGSNFTEEVWNLLTEKMIEVKVVFIFVHYSLFNMDILYNHLFLYLSF